MEDTSEWLYDFRVRREKNKTKSQHERGRVPSLPVNVDCGGRVVGVVIQTGEHCNPNSQQLLHSACSLTGRFAGGQLQQILLLGGAMSPSPCGRLIYSEVVQPTCCLITREVIWAV